MSGFNKVLVVISVLLLGVTVFEIFIYQSSFFAKPSVVEEKPEKTVREDVNERFKAFMSANAIDPANLRFTYAKKGILSSSVVNNTYNGKITSIDRTPGKLPNSDFQYVLRIGLTGENGAYNDFYYNAKDVEILNNTAIAQIDKGLITAETLKLGDEVTIIKVFDLLKDSNNSTLEFKIIKNSPNEIPKAEN